MKTVLTAAFVMFAATVSAPATDYSSVIPKLESIVNEEIRDWGIGGIAVALVDGQQTVYEQGFGEAKRDSVFRAGSVSKLFNAIAVMQQVEAGKLDLDAPIPAEYLPSNPFPDQPAVTLRHLLCHRSGLQRESPTGGYFDGTQPGLEATARSLPGCALVTRPGEMTRYSNIAPSLAGYLVTRAAGLDWEEYQKQHVLGPLGMTQSAWTLAGLGSDRLIVSHMRVADGKGGWTRRESPVFDLGTLPAGNLYSTAGDLAKFASALLAGGRGLVKPATLREMWTPQFTGDRTGYGLAFVIGSFRGYRTIGHNGAVYGHSTSFVVLPEAGIAAVVLGNEDIANARISRISEAALSLMLEAKTGEPAPADPQPYSYDAEQAKRLAGEYESESYWASLTAGPDALTGNVSGQPVRFTPAGPGRFTAASRIDHNVPVSFEFDSSGNATGFTYGRQRFVRVKNPAPAAPGAWEAFTGSYGPDFIPVIISIRNGNLYAMTENMVDYRLTPVTRTVFALPPGMYTREYVVFQPGPDGQVHSIDFASMTFHRNP